MDLFYSPALWTNYRYWHITNFALVVVYIFTSVFTLSCRILLESFSC